MKLTDRFEDFVVIDGIEYDLDLSFDNVLRIHELNADGEVGEIKKIEFMFEMLVINSSNIDLSVDEKEVVVEDILTKYIIEKEKVQKVEPEQNEILKQKTYDIEKDASLIYSSFLLDYGIDLFEQHGKLQWKKFTALLNGLSEKTAFMQVVNIRTMEIPKANKTNAKERAQIRKLKRIYSLDDEDAPTVSDAFDSIAKVLGKAGEKDVRR